MSEYVLVADPAAVTYPVDVSVTPASTRRNRITCAFRVFLALPHILLVGGPMAIAITWFTSESTEQGAEWGSAGVLGTVAIVVAVISWFAIVFTGRQPTGLWNLASFFLHWRVRAVSYLMLLCDDYPPFGEGAYPAHLSLRPPIETRDRVTVAFRVVLAIPHVLALWVLGLGWLMTTLIAWFAILFTGNYPRTLFSFGIGVLRWTTRVEAYLLLLRDEYPPFAMS